MTRRRPLLRRERDGPAAVPWTALLALCAVAVGLLVGRGTDTRMDVGGSWYLPAAGLLLAVGLYGSTHQIDRSTLRRDLRTVVVAVTLGVFLKATLIAAVMMTVCRKPEYLVLGIAVAQIDPLSVAAMSASRRMSDRAKDLLSVWAAFDDPMTVLMSLYFSVLAFRLSGRSGSPGLVLHGSGTASYLADLGLNLLLFLAAAAAWYLPRALWRGHADRRAARSEQPEPPRTAPRLADGQALLVVLLLVLVAARTLLMLAVALAGLVVRTGRHQPLIDRLVTGAFLVASFGLGLLLANGASLLTGLLLGVTAFAAQGLIALLIVPRLMPDLARTDQVYLGLGQQNGITAIILALALEPDFPGTVGIVGPAILTVNVLYYCSNAIWARRLRTRPAPHAPPPPAVPARPNEIGGMPPVPPTPGVGDG